MFFFRIAKEFLVFDINSEAILVFSSLHFTLFFLMEASALFLCLFEAYRRFSLLYPVFWNVTVMWGDFAVHFMGSFCLATCIPYLWERFWYLSCNILTPVFGSETAIRYSTLRTVSFLPFLKLFSSLLLYRFLGDLLDFLNIWDFNFYCYTFKFQ